jgi:hypothetical protein
VSARVGQRRSISRGRAAASWSTSTCCLRAACALTASRMLTGVSPPTQPSTCVGPGCPSERGGVDCGEVGRFPSTAERSSPPNLAWTVVLGMNRLRAWVCLPTMPLCGLPSVSGGGLHLTRSAGRQWRGRPSPRGRHSCYRVGQRPLAWRRRERRRQRTATLEVADRASNASPWKCVQLEW